MTFRFIITLIMRHIMLDDCALCKGDLFVTKDQKHVYCIVCLWSAPVSVWAHYCEVTQWLKLVKTVLKYFLQKQSKKTFVVCTVTMNFILQRSGKFEVQILWSESTAYPVGWVLLEMWKRYTSCDLVRSCSLATLHEMRRRWNYSPNAWVNFCVTFN